MGRPRKPIKPASEMATDEVLESLFPKRAVKEAKEEVRKANEKAIKKEDTP